jgi:hypothetical protein
LYCVRAAPGCARSPAQHASTTPAATAASTRAATAASTRAALPAAHEHRDGGAPAAAFHLYRPRPFLPPRRAHPKLACLHAHTLHRAVLLGLTRVPHVPTTAAATCGGAAGGVAGGGGAAPHAKPRVPLQQLPRALPPPPPPPPPPAAAAAVHDPEAEEREERLIAKMSEAGRTAEAHELHAWFKAAEAVCNALQRRRCMAALRELCGVVVDAYASDRSHSIRSAAVDVKRMADDFWDAHADMPEE